MMSAKRQILNVLDHLRFSVDPLSLSLAMTLVCVLCHGGIGGQRGSLPSTLMLCCVVRDNRVWGGIAQLRLAQSTKCGYLSTLILLLGPSQSDCQSRQHECRLECSILRSEAVGSHYLLIG